MPNFNSVRQFYADKPKILSIARVPYSSQEMIYTEYVLKGVPVIITGYFELLASSTYLDILKKNVGDSLVKVRVDKTGTLTEYSSERTYEEEKLSAYLSRPTLNRYLSNCTIQNLKLTDISLAYPDFFGKEYFDAPRIWIGDAGSNTPLHRDSTDNFSFQLVGRKEWTIFNVQDESCLYFEENEYGKQANQFSEFAVSSVDLNNPDTIKFPLFRTATPLTFEVMAGDLLYLPMGWGHSVCNKEFSLMVNLWHRIGSIKPGVLQNE